MLVMLKPVCRLLFIHICVTMVIWFAGKSPTLYFFSCFFVIHDLFGTSPFQWQSICRSFVFYRSCSVEECVYESNKSLRSLYHSYPLQAVIALMEMGFDEKEVIDALRVNNNQQDAAVGGLLYWTKRLHTST